MPAARSGWESDTGERDNPTYDNFRTNTPVTKTRKIASHRNRVLNREGRAICRTVYAHGNWSTRRIARIFGVSQCSIRRAIDNGYSPRDVVGEDYAHLKDPDFSKHFPPGATAPSQRHLTKRVTTDDEEEDSSDDEYIASSRVLQKRKGQEHESSACMRLRVKYTNFRSFIKDLLRLRAYEATEGIRSPRDGILNPKWSQAGGNVHTCRALGNG
ncbi:hypothetical protein FB45DRAFT_864574 [Roridomyces roridus]|uniref:Uncharacterized protein n=1 Tax=Roridomyces roridus TaxID=1738132 RepID=A0AAD7C134_9AGAR|nr:hypothetical protein FB45DRAFT_864574 [Roridomyces roridus]